jgi:hypothetical protein
MFAVQMGNILGEPTQMFPDAGMEDAGRKKLFPSKRDQCWENHSIWVTSE